MGGEVEVELGYCSNVLPLIFARHLDLALQSVSIFTVEIHRVRVNAWISLLIAFMSRLLVERTRRLPMILPDDAQRIGDCMHRDGINHIKI